MSADRTCILALDLGTSAFKAAWVDQEGRIGPVTTIAYSLEQAEGHVTCPASRYWDCAIRGLKHAAETAQHAGLRPAAIGITSQAQTFVTLNSLGKTTGPAIVWTDETAVEEAGKAAVALPDFAETSGFVRPSPMQFLPKVMARREDPRGCRYLLLSEWIIHRLTGRAIGDTCSQGMGGFWDISRGTWNERALTLAGITPEQLAPLGPPGELSKPLSLATRQSLGLPALQVFSCGNDNTAGGAGAGLAGPGELYCTFGTAMVVYGLAAGPVVPVTERQIAGVGPWPGSRFLLAVARTVGREMSEQFGLLHAEVRQALGPARRIVAGGGMSANREWLDLLEQRYGIEFETCATEHVTLLGVAKIISRQNGAS